MGVAQSLSVTAWEEYLDYLGTRAAITLLGEPLSSVDSSTAVLSGLCLASYAASYSFLDEEIPSHLRRWLGRYVKCDLFSLFTDLKEIKTCIRNNGADFSSFASFKHSLGKFPNGWFLDLVQDMFSVRDLGERIRVIHQAICFLEKLDVSVDALDASTKDSFFSEQEKRRSRTPLSPYRDQVRGVIREWFSGFESFLREEFVPHHGPGAVAERKRCSISEKYSISRLTRRQSYIYRNLGLDVPTPVLLSDDDRINATAKCIMVAKGVLSKRMIAKEPAGLMFTQQAVKDRLYAWVENHPYLSHKIDLRDQSKNQALVYEAAKTRRYATIDLSSASDNVLWSHVRHCFQDFPFLLQVFSCSRSRYYEIDGEVFRQGSFAPMGAAFSFPIETIFFAAICEVAGNELGRRFHYRVYGDDIIVREEANSLTIEILESFGHVVNTTKSFSGQTPFRESCGCMCWGDHLITPIQIARKFSAEPSMNDPESIMGFIAVINRLCSPEWGVARSVLLNVLKRVTRWRVPPFSSTPDKGIYSPCPTNFTARQKVDEYGRNLVRVFGLRTETERGSDDVAYAEWHRTHRHRSRPYHIDLDGPCGTRVGSSRSHWGPSWIFLDDLTG